MVSCVLIVRKIPMTCASMLILRNASTRPVLKRLTAITIASGRRLKRLVNYLKVGNEQPCHIAAKYPVRALHDNRSVAGTQGFLWPCCIGGRHGLHDHGGYH